MSATGRGAKRHPDDFYATPSWATRSFLQVFKGYSEPLRILEPCAGEGAIIKECRLFWPDSEIDAIEIDKERCLAIAGVNDKICTDFLEYEFCEKEYDLIITNPPFKLALPFIEKSLHVADTVCMLLRLNFLGSQKRYRFWKEHPCAVYILPKRPSFTMNSSTDATEYAWFMWGKWAKLNHWDVLEILK